MSRLKSTALFFSWISVVSFAWASDEATKTFLSDDFRDNTLRRYEVQGAIDWKPGRLTLSRSAQLRRNIRLGSVFVLKATVVMTEEKENQGVHFRFAGDQGSCKVALLQSPEGTRLVNRSEEISLARNGTTGAAWLLRVEVRYGMSKVKAWRQGSDEPQAWLSTRFSGSANLEPRSITVACQSTSGCTLTNLMLTGEPIAPRLAVEVEDKVKRAFSLNAEVERIIRQARHRQALDKIAEAYDLAKSVLGEDHPHLAQILNNYGAVLKGLGDYAAARIRYEQALKIRSRSFGAEHPYTTTLLNNLGGLATETGDFVEAEALYQRALTLQDKVLGRNHYYTAVTLNSLGYFHRVTGDYESARAYYEQTLEVRSALFGPEHRSTAIVLDNLAVLLRLMGDYPTARVYQERTLAIREKILGKDDPAIAVALNNMGALLKEVGDLAAAHSYFDRALGICERVLGEHHRYTAATCNNAAYTAFQLKEYERATAYFERALAIHQKTAGPRHAKTAISLHNLGRVFERTGSRDKALHCYQQALAIGLEVHGPQHPDIVATQVSLGTLHWDMGDPEASLPLLQKALAIRTRVLGEDHPDTASSHSNLGLLLFCLGRKQEAHKHLRAAHSVQLRIAQRLLYSLSEAESLLYVAATRSGRDPFLSLLRQMPELRSQRYQAVWETRALASRAITRRRESVDRLPQARQLWRELRRLRYQLAQLTLAAVTPAKADARSQRLGELTVEKERLERKLGSLSNRFAREQRIGDAGFEDLAACLPPTAAVVDIVDTTNYTVSESDALLRRERHYEAFVLRKSPRTPGYTVAWADLGPAEPIDKSVRSWRREILPAEAIARSTDPGYDRPGQTLRKLVWEEISPHLSGCETVIFIPDGSLSGVPWSALPGQRPGSYLVDDYSIATASSGPHLYALLTQQQSGGSEAVFVGSVSYDGGDGEPRANRLASRRPVMDQRKRLRWQSLPKTRDEILTIASFSKSEPLVLSGGDATEAALRQEMPKARYIHLATHGFFADPEFRSAFQHDLTREYLFGRQHATITGRSPLILSGVVLAGANRAAKTDDWGAPIGDDGILTAEEVVNQDLRNTELVVLSACETGLGTVAGGEGVMGLQRAFAHAGARTTVASLWKVDDDATKTLMVEFYRNLWEKKLGKLESLRRAQLNLIKHYDPKSGEVRGLGKKSVRIKTRPGGVPPQRLPAYYWAAFTLNGDWR